MNVQPALLFLGALYRDGAAWAEAAGLLVAAFGPLDPAQLEFAFEGTDYYREEMGEGLRRRFCVFDAPVAQERLAVLKRQTGAIEARLAVREGDRTRRRVNLDPGLLSLGNLVLASTKGFTHRVYLGGGIHAEVTLLFRDGAYQPLEWTYPDYRREETRRWLEARRRKWRERLRRESPGEAHALATPAAGGAR